MADLFGTDVARNPILRDVSRSFNGKTVRAYEVDLKVDVSGSRGPDGALRRVFDVIARTATPIMISGTYTNSDNDNNAAFYVFVEGDFGTDDYNGDGTPTTFAAFLQAEIRGLGADAGQEDLDLTGATVEEEMGSPYFADRVEAEYSQS